MSWFTEALMTIYANKLQFDYAAWRNFNEQIIDMDNFISRLNFGSPLGVKLHMLVYLRKWLNLHPEMPIDTQLMGSLVVAQKMHEDGSYYVSGIVKRFWPIKKLSAQQRRKLIIDTRNMEAACLQTLQFNTNISLQEVEVILNNYCSNQGLLALRQEVLSSTSWNVYEKYKLYKEAEFSRTNRTYGMQGPLGHLTLDHIQQTMAELRHSLLANNWDDFVEFYTMINTVLCSKGLTPLGIVAPMVLDALMPESPDSLASAVSPPRSFLSQLLSMFCNQGSLPSQSISHYSDRNVSQAKR